MSTKYIQDTKYKNHKSYMSHKYISSQPYNVATQSQHLNKWHIGMAISCLIFPDE